MSQFRIEQTHKPIAEAQVRKWARVPSATDRRRRYLVVKVRWPAGGFEYRCGCDAGLFRPQAVCRHVRAFQRQEQRRRLATFQRRAQRQRRAAP